MGIAEMGCKAFSSTVYFFEDTFDAVAGVEDAGCQRRVASLCCDFHE